MFPCNFVVGSFRVTCRLLYSRVSFCRLFPCFSSFVCVCRGGGGGWGGAGMGRLCHVCVFFLRQNRIGDTHNVNKSM